MMRNSGIVFDLISAIKIIFIIFIALPTLFAVRCHSDLDTVALDICYLLPNRLLLHLVFVL